MIFGDKLRQLKSQKAAEQQQQHLQAFQNFNNFVGSLVNNPQFEQACRQAAQKGEYTIEIDYPQSLQGLDIIVRRMLTHQPTPELDRFRQYIGGAAMRANSDTLKIGWQLPSMGSYAPTKLIEELQQTARSVRNEQHRNEREQKKQLVNDYIDKFLANNSGKIQQGCVNAVNNGQNNFQLIIPEQQITDLMRYGRFERIFSEFPAIQKWEQELGVTIIARIKVPRIGETGHNQATVIFKW